jgi:hypothetical protein
MYARGMTVREIPVFLQEQYPSQDRSGATSSFENEHIKMSAPIDIRQLRAKNSTIATIMAIFYAKIRVSPYFPSLKPR